MELGFPLAQWQRNLPARSKEHKDMHSILGQENPLGEKEMATHLSIL